MDDSPGYRVGRSDASPARRRHKNHRGTDETASRKLPVGPVQTIISIAKQRATLFINDERIAEAPISTGVRGHPTPMGVFMVIAKSRYHSSNIYSGAPMPYMQRITWSGIALHQGPLPGYPASHGCIRLPEAFAVKLWKISKLGARVIVTRDETAPSKFDSPRLFVPKKPPAAPVVVTETPAPTVTASTDPIAVPDTAPATVSPPPEPAPPVAEPPKRKGPVQVFVSRKDAKLYVRQDFAPLFEAPITIAAPDKAWGTHVFTVTDIREDKADWVAVTIPSGYARPERHSRKHSAKDIDRQQRAAELADAPTAAQALERFDMPQDAVERISELLAPGSALTVSDNALSDETGEETDFIVLTP